MKKNNKGTNIKNTIYKHISNNIKEYTLVVLLFIIGVFLGVMFINNSQEEQINELTSYINNFVEKFKSTEDLNIFELLKSSILQNVILAISLWFFGTTVIGIPIVFGIVLYRGFCLGYTIAAITTIMGLGKGISFVLVTLLLQNIILIPAMIAIAVSGYKLYKSIVKNRDKENIKVEILRHTVFSLIMLVLLCIASVVEILVSTNILKKIIKYF